MRVRERTRMLPGMNDRADNVVHSDPVFDLGKNNGATTSHRVRVTLHYAEIGAHSLRQIGLVDDEQIGLGNARTALARNFIPAGHIYYIDAEVRQLAAKMGSQIIAARFDQKQFGVENRVEFLQR